MFIYGQRLKPLHFKPRHLKMVFSSAQSCLDVAFPVYPLDHLDYTQNSKNKKVRGLAKGVGRKGVSLIGSEKNQNKSEEIGANRNKLGYSRKQEAQIRTNRKKKGKSEQIRTNRRPQTRGSDKCYQNLRLQ